MISAHPEPVEGPFELYLQILISPQLHDQDAAPVRLKDQSIGALFNRKVHEGLGALDSFDDADLGP